MELELVIIKDLLRCLYNQTYKLSTLSKLSR